MKSFRINQADMLSHDNIEKSFLKPSRGKRNREDVRAVLDNLEQEIEIVSKMLKEGTFKPKKHLPTVINEGSHQKVRRIIKPDYRYEQVVHHIVVQSMSEAIEHGMYIYVLGSVPNRGAHLGAKVIEKWIRTDKENTKYVLKMDIRHFFESVDHDILKKWLQKKFRDKFILDLLFLIIDGVDTGLPLGFYTSQWLANFLLQPLDHYIKEQLHVDKNTRYMDDIVCFGRNKKELHRVRKCIDEYLTEELHLTMKGNWQVFRFEYETEEYAVMCDSLRNLEHLGNDLDKMRIRHKSKQHRGKRKIFIKVVSVRAKTEALNELFKKYHANVEIVTMVHGRPLDYMGFEFHRNKTILRKSIMLNMNRRVRKVAKQDKINPKDAASVLSSIGWVDHTDTYGMYEQRIKPIVNIKKLKKVVSKRQRRLNASEKIKLEKSRRNTGSTTIGVGNRQNNRVSSQGCKGTV